MSLQPNKKDPRVIRTRKLIMDAFRSLGMEKDIESITVRDIAERATVNRTTFYAHFEDKNVLLDAIIYDEFLNVVMNRLKTGEVLNEKTLRDLIIAMCDYNDKIYECRRKLVSINTLVDSKVQLQLKHIILTMLGAGEAHLSIQSEKMELLASIISSTIYGTTNRWCTEHNIAMTRDDNTFAEELLLFLMSGIKTFANGMQV